MAAARPVSICRKPRADEALLQRERWYRTLSESLPHLIWTCQSDGPCDYLSPQWVAYTGIPESEQLGYRWLEQLHPDDRERVIAEWAAVAAHGDSFDIEFRIRRADGMFRWFSARAIPLRDSNGHVVKWIGSNTDISARKAAEARYRGLLEAAPDAMVVVDQRGEIVLLNVRTEKQFGYSRDELIGQPVTNIIPEGFAERIIADDLRSAADALAQQIGTGIELVALRKDGTEFPIEIMLSPLESAEGILVTAAIRDISARKAAEEELFVEKELAVVTLNSISDAVISADTSGNITLLNVVAERMTGQSSQEAAGRPIADVLRVLDATTREIVAIPVEAAVRNDRTEHLPSGCLLIRRDGHEIAIADSVSPIHDREDNVTGAVIVVRDESAAREMARRIRAVGEELERSNRELDDFAAIASHDLQEPLRKIQAFGDRLAEHSSSALDDEARDYLSRMTDAASRMQILISDLLEYSQVAVRPEPPQPVDLGQVVTEVLSDLDEGIRSGHGSVIVGRLPTVSASPLQMRQLFQNLIANALKFHPEGVAPEVHLEAAARDDEDGVKGGCRGTPIWEISVRDNGIGFDEKYAERIFAPFQRLNGRQAFEGAGMGLAICRRIVTFCGGTITASSHPGAGATFLLTLPGVALGTQAGGRAG
jgi:PAS domain S-box-containing protein